MTWMKKIILQYMEELNKEAPVDEEDLEYRANGLVAHITRLSRARRDFRPERGGKSWQSQS